MRHLLIILLIAMLPARGWAAGDMSVTMAMNMAQNTLAVDEVSKSVATKIVSNYSISTGAIGTFSSENQVFEPPASSTATLAAEGVGDVEDASLAPCQGCHACQLCMALVTGFAGPVVSSKLAPQAVQASYSTPFSSAERAPGFKPPIS